MIFSLHFVCFPISFPFPLYSLRDTYSLFLSDHFSSSQHHINAIFIVEVGRIYRILFNEYLSLVSRLPYCPLLAFPFFPTTTLLTSEFHLLSSHLLFSFPMNNHRLPLRLIISDNLLSNLLNQYVCIKSMNACITSTYPTKCHALQCSF